MLMLFAFNINLISTYTDSDLRDNGNYANRELTTHSLTLGTTTTLARKLAT